MSAPGWWWLEPNMKRFQPLLSAPCSTRISDDPANSKCRHSIIFSDLLLWFFPHRRAINQFREVSVAFYCQTIIGLLLIPPVRLDVEKISQGAEKEQNPSRRFASSSIIVIRKKTPAPRNEDRILAYNFTIILNSSNEVPTWTYLGFNQTTVSPGD